MFVSLLNNFNKQIIIFIYFFFHFQITGKISQKEDDTPDMLHTLTIDFIVIVL